jgi:DNA topoisomerase-1
LSNERFEGFFSIDATLSLASKSAVANAKASSLLLKSVLSFTSMSSSAALTVIEKEFGRDYHQERRFKTKDAGAQEAHEAIRPTDLTKSEIFGLEHQAAKLRKCE